MSEQFELPKRPASFGSDSELLEMTQRLLQLRSDPERAKEAKKWQKLLHDSIELTLDATALTSRFIAAEVNPLQREILLALLLSHLGMSKEEIRSSADLIRELHVDGAEILEVLRAVSEEGHLCRTGLLGICEPDADVREQRLALDPTLAEAVLFERGGSPQGWPIATESELHDRMCVLTRALSNRSLAVQYLEIRSGDHEEVFKASRRVERCRRMLWLTLEAHPNWGTRKLLRFDAGGEYRPSNDFNTTILLALLGRELGHVSADEVLFTGFGLARAHATDPMHVRRHLRRLNPELRVLRENLVQPCDGVSVLLSDDPEELGRAEFELTDKALETAGIQRSLIKRRDGEAVVRKAQVRMENLVLSARVRRSLTLAATQAKHPDILLDKWGMRELVPYGRGMVMLFYGPPGVGKTACAEAVANELNRPIMVADYSQVQNCFVGQTEKNIVRTFREAKQHQAVLFWDEADAMFFDRDSANRNWEVRDVNVLLQELERFDGTCILATNRQVTLDPALERRIALKVEFNRPTAEQRHEIWRRMLPSSLPLAKSVDIDAFAGFDLSGGEIKNVVLNAARRALQRGLRARVKQEDFLAAIEDEIDGKWNSDGRCRMGFGA